MIEEYEKWRIDFGVDKLNEDFDFPEYPVIKKYYPRYFIFFSVDCVDFTTKQTS
jgi:hypothetical protein